jgi:hypothetical protein
LNFFKAVNAGDTAMAHASTSQPTTQPTATTTVSKFLNLKNNVKKIF